MTAGGARRGGDVGDQQAMRTHPLSMFVDGWGHAAYLPTAPGPGPRLRRPRALLTNP
ncbi:hypothetical protein RKD19_007960 [Streptomyces canus]